MRIGLLLLKSLLGKREKNLIASRIPLVGFLEAVLRVHQLHVLIRDAVQVAVVFLVHESDRRVLGVDIHLRHTADERNDNLLFELAVRHAHVTDAGSRAANLMPKRNALKAVQKLAPDRLVVHALVIKNRQKRVVLLLPHLVDCVFINLVFVTFVSLLVAVLMRHDIRIQIAQAAVMQFAVISKVRQNGGLEDLVHIA